ncbi:MFS transporter, partial [Alicyclobacillaceae bacterium I2511]
MQQNLRWLYMARAIRSFVTAFLTVAFPLYLAANGDSSTQIGVILSVSGLVTVALVAAVGFIGDRYGRRIVILMLAILSCIGSVTLLFFTAFVPVVLASGLGG